MSVLQLLNHGVSHVLVSCEPTPAASRYMAREVGVSCPTRTAKPAGQGREPGNQFLVFLGFARMALRGAWAASGGGQAKGPPGVLGCSACGFGWSKYRNIKCGARLIPTNTHHFARGG